MPLPPFLIPMAVRNLPWRLIAIVAAIVALLSAGIWFRGVLADRDALTVQNEAHAQEVINLNGEIERMNKQDAADHALFENIEAQKKIHAAEIQNQTENIRKLRKELSDATRSCFYVVLPPAYLDGLPKAGN